MATDVITELASLDGLTLQQIADLPTIDLSRIVPGHPGPSRVPVASFSSSI